MNKIFIALPVHKHLYLSVSFINNRIVHTEYHQSSASGQQICSTELSENLLSREILSNKADQVFAKKIQFEVDCYFKQASFSFSLPCELHQGTEFQYKVWQALRAIPSGEVRTYGILAKQLKTSALAIGQACRKNHFPLIVPCHRVVAASGIGGYAGDTSGRQKGSINFLDIKRSLLAHEKAQLK